MSRVTTPGRWTLDAIADELAARPPRDLPPDYAAIRSVGAMRIWGGSLWRWDGREWQRVERLVSPPGVAAERFAPRSEGHGPGGGDPEGRTGDLGGSR